MPDPAPPAETRTICASLLADLPATVLDGERRKVSPGGLSAAWGSPAIILRCGVEQPAGLTPASECVEVNGVGWFSEQADGGYLYTTIGRSAFVELAVPTDYKPEVNALVDVAATVTAHDPLQKPCV